jgi:hypothetical protein
VSNVTRVYLYVSCVQCYTCLSFCVLCPMLTVSVFLCLVSNVACIYLYVSCVQCYLCLSFCVLCPMFPVSIFLCLVSNVSRVYLSLSCVQCFPCLSFCFSCPMLHVSISLCLVSHVTRVYLFIGHKTQKDRHGKHWAQEIERQTRLTLGTSHRKIDTCNIGQCKMRDRVLNR